MMLIVLKWRETNGEKKLKFLLKVTCFLIGNLL